MRHHIRRPYYFGIPMTSPAPQPDRAMPWEMVAGVAAQLADGAATTIGILVYGGTEGNPIAAWLMGICGVVAGVAILKSLVLGCMFVWPKVWVPPLVCGLLGFASWVPFFLGAAP